MDKIKNLIIVFFSITALVGLIGAVTPTTTQGQGGSKDVNVVNTPTVQAQQSGAWNVGIAGTPTVNVGSTTANPVWVRDVDEESRQPFQELRIVEFGETVSNASSLFNQIPAGKRLVIEHISAEAFLPPGQTMVCAMGVQVYGHFNRHYLTLISQGFFAGSPNDFDLFTASQPIRLYADSGTQPQANCRRSGTASAAQLNIIVSGHFVNVP